MCTHCPRCSYVHGWWFGWACRGCTHCNCNLCRFHLGMSEIFLGSRCHDHGCQPELCPCPACAGCESSMTPPRPLPLPQLMTPPRGPEAYLGFAVAGPGAPGANGGPAVASQGVLGAITDAGVPGATRGSALASAGTPLESPSSTGSGLSEASPHLASAGPQAGRSCEVQGPGPLPTVASLDTITAWYLARLGPFLDRIKFNLGPKPTVIRFATACSGTDIPGPCISAIVKNCGVAHFVFAAGHAIVGIMSACLPARASIFPRICRGLSVVCAVLSIRWSTALPIRCLPARSKSANGSSSE